MRIIVDGDACPGISIIEGLSKKYGVELLIYCDIHHNIVVDYGEVKIVDCGFQSVDMYISNISKKGDIIVSQDYGVAAICLGKGAAVISPKGNIYTDDNIATLLEQRYISQKIRKAGGRTPNPKKRIMEDNIKLKNILENLIKTHLERGF